MNQRTHFTLSFYHLSIAIRDTLEYIQKREVYPKQIYEAKKNTIKLSLNDNSPFTNFCKNNGFGIPKTYVDVKSINKEDFPLFLKPVVGKSGVDTFKVYSFDNLNEILSKENDFIIQECVEAPEYTIDLFLRLGKRIKIITVKNKSTE